MLPAYRQGSETIPAPAASSRKWSRLFRSSKRTVPVFNHKHLAYNWPTPNGCTSKSKELGFPMMAGLQRPRHLRPELTPETGIDWGVRSSRSVMAPVYAEAFGAITAAGSVAVYGGAAQREARTASGQSSTSKGNLPAAKARGQVGPGALDAALASGAGKGPVEQEDAEPIVYLIEYLGRPQQPAVYLFSLRHVRNSRSPAGRGQGSAAGVFVRPAQAATGPFQFPGPGGSLHHGVSPGRRPIPSKHPADHRPGSDALWKANLKGGDGIETPELAVKYSV